MGKRKTALFSTVLILSISPLIWAQVSDDTGEQREFLQIDRVNDDSYNVIETAEELFEQIKNRAVKKIKERKRKFLKKTRITASVISGYETNPLSEPDEDVDEDGDGFVTETIKFEWLPKFTRYLKLDATYRIYNKTYFNNKNLNYLGNSLEGSLKFYPFKGVRVEPGVQYYNVHYYHNDRIRYGQIEPFLKFKTYVSEKWNVGGRYEYSHKKYTKRMAREITRAAIDDKERRDNRHTLNLYATRYFGNFTVRIRGRYLTNNSNDQYQNFYDFDSVRGYFTVAKKFFNEKLYVSFTPNFEKRQYVNRIASGTTTREDRIMNYHFNCYYELAKNLEIRYSFYHQNSNSNSSSGKFTNIINTLGFTKRF